MGAIVLPTLRVMPSLSNHDTCFRLPLRHQKRKGSFGLFWYLCIVARHPDERSQPGPVHPTRLNPTALRFRGKIGAAHNQTSDDGALPTTQSRVVDLCEFLNPGTSIIPPPSRSQATKSPVSSYRSRRRVYTKAPP